MWPLERDPLRVGRTGLPVTTVLLVPGTWNRRSAVEWWAPGAELPHALREHGFSVSAVDAGVRRWRWTGALDGLVGRNDRWEEAGESLRWFLEARPSDAIVAHSHGGNVAALALAAGATASVLVTVGMPVRPEMFSVYRSARRQVRRWLNVYSDVDVWQWLGGVSLTPLRLCHGRRRVPYARNRLARGLRHGELLLPSVWTAHGWWSALEAHVEGLGDRQRPADPVSG